MQSDSWDGGAETVEERRSERVGLVPRREEGRGDEAAARHGEDDGRGKQEEAEDLARRAAQNPRGESESETKSKRDENQPESRPSSLHEKV